MRMSVCSNCLNNGASPVPVGPEKGGQRDPYRDTVDLCLTCKNALLSGDFTVLHHRYTDQRTITVGAQGER